MSQTNLAKNIGERITDPGNSYHKIYVNTKMCNSHETKLSKLSEYVPVLYICV
jgi:translation initiation factor 2 beta subunit (eIF-2beta)/eIF-5